MKRILIGLAVGVAALSVSAPALAGTWHDFRASGGDLHCSINQTGSALCMGWVNARLSGWTVSAGTWGMYVTSPSGAKVWKRTSTGYNRPDFHFPANWNLRNEGVACKADKLVVGCMLREGSMAGWAFIMAPDVLEVLDTNSHVVFHRGLYVQH